MRGNLTEKQRLLQNNTRLKNENAKLRKEKIEVNKEMVELKKIVETMALRIEELEKALFGSKSDRNDDSGILSNSKKPKSKKIRNKSSYNRNIPKQSEITDRKYHLIENCTDCNNLLKNKKIVVFYEETIDIGNKKVIEHKIEKGYCSYCRKYVSSIGLPTSKAFLGNEIKEKLFGGSPAVGETVRIKNLPFTVIGVMRPKLQISSYYSNDRGLIFIPASTFEKILGWRYVSKILYRPKDPTAARRTKATIRALLATRHGYDPSDPRGCNIFDTQKIVDMLDAAVMLRWRFLTM